MAQDGCQPMERFAFAKNGSAQKSWASCPSSTLPQYGGQGQGQGTYPNRSASAGTYEQRPYSVSGYVDGYNPSLPKYPPTRAQLEAAAKQQRGPGSAPPSGGYGGEIASQMSAQIRFEQARASGGSAGSHRVSAPPPPPGQDFRALAAYSGHGAWDGPAPRGDPSKPAPGTPYYLRTPPEPAHDPSAEERDVPLVTRVAAAAGEAAASTTVRLPVLGAHAKHAPIALPLGYRRVACSTNAEHCTPEHLRAAADAIEKAAAAAPVFVSLLVAPADVASDDALASAVDRVARALRVDAVDLATLEWPSKDPAELERAWRRMEALVMSGKVRAIGLANASVPTVETIRASCAVAPAAIEVETHPLMAQRKLAGVCRRYGVQPSAIAPLGAMNPALLEHPKLLEAAAMEDKADGEGKTRGRRSPAALLLRWSAQRGVPFVVDAGASDAIVREGAETHGFRLMNAQKALIDAMEPPPREGGTRFQPAPEGFAFDDPFLGGVARPGLDLERENQKTRE